MFIALPAAVLLLIVLLGLIVLCINRRTRVVGLVLLGLLGCLIFACMALFSLRARPVHMVREMQYSYSMQDMPRHIVPPNTAPNGPAFDVFQDVFQEYGLAQPPPIPLDPVEPSVTPPIPSTARVMEDPLTAPTVESQESGLAPEPSESAPPAITIAAKIGANAQDRQPANSEASTPPTRPEAGGGPDIQTSQTPPPPWVNQASGWKDGIYQVVLVSDPRASVEECEEQLNEKLLQVAGRFVYENYAEPYTHEPEGWYLHQIIRGMRLTPSALRATIARETYVEDHYSENLLRTMKRVHLLVAIDKGAQRNLQQQWQRYHDAEAAREAEDVQCIVCGIALALLAALGLVYGFLKFDTATKGYYTKRLLIGSVVATILVALLVALIADL